MALFFCPVTPLPCSAPAEEKKPISAVPSGVASGARPGPGGSWPLHSVLPLKGTCPALLLSLPNPLEAFPRCTYGITVPTLQRKQLKPCYNSLMLTSEWRDYPPLQKATCLFNAVFTCLKVNFIKSLSLPAPPPGSSPSVSRWGQSKPRALVAFPAGNISLKAAPRWGLWFHFVQGSQLIRVPSSTCTGRSPAHFWC